MLRLADGPDEVHRNQIARLELKRYQEGESLSGGSAKVLAADRTPGLRRRPVWIA
jgi:acyl-CoA dehydrogenase